MLLRLTSLAGIFLLVAIGWAASKDRRHINWKTVVAGLSLQFVFALLVLKSAPGRWFFEVLSEGVRKLISFTDRGAEKRDKGPRHRCAVKDEHEDRRTQHSHCG